MLPLSATSVAAIDLTSPGFGLDDIGWQTVQIEDAIPGVMSSSGTHQGAPYYHIEMAEGTHSHHDEIPDTPVWGYKGPGDSEGQFPGKTIEARVNQRARVEFDNQLPSSHIFDVDTAVHGTKLSDYEERYPEWAEEQFGGPEEFPEVRAVTHAHGLHVESASDGLPEQWTSPGGVTGPQYVKDVYDYTNRQDEATLWYHDHALGLTRMNVYAGLAGFYILRGPQEERLGLPDGDREVPILFQDRAFHNGDEGPEGEYKYPADFEAEVSGDVSVVNGLAWPSFEVDPAQYRFRILNGSNGRFFNVQLRNDTASDETDVPTIYQIGTDLGFLEDVVPVGPDDSLLLGPAERADVLVDFSDHAGETLTVTNDAGFPFGSPGDTGTNLPELAQFRVRDTDPEDPTVDPTALNLPNPERFSESATVQTRQMGLVSPESDPSGLDTHLLDEGNDGEYEHWNDDVVTKPQLGTTEVWELVNHTGDAHPIHLHLVDFQVIGRGDGTQPPEQNERGNKDTVSVYAGETVRIIARFGNFSGRYVWHCHILEHEDQEMMRPYEVVRGNGGN